MERLTSMRSIFCHAAGHFDGLVAVNCVCDTAFTNLYNFFTHLMVANFHNNGAMEMIAAILCEREIIFSNASNAHNQHAFAYVIDEKINVRICVYAENLRTNSKKLCLL